KAMADFDAIYIIKNLSIQKADLLIDCKYHPMNIRNFQISKKNNQQIAPGVRDCTFMKPILESIYEGKKCFTYFSDIFDMEKAPNPNGYIVDELDTSGRAGKQPSTIGKVCDPPNYCGRNSLSEEFIN